MTASLYQSASGPATTLEATTGALPAMPWGGGPVQLQDVGRHRGGIEADVVAPPAPGVAGPGQEVFDLEGGAVGVPELREGQVDPTGLGPAGVEVDDHQQGVVGGDLGVGDESVVVDGDEAGGSAALERGVGVADAVDRGDHHGQAVRSVEVPGADLVLLRMQVLLRSRGHRR